MNASEREEHVGVLRAISRVERIEREWLRWLIRKSPEYRPDKDPHLFDS